MRVFFYLAGDAVGMKGNWIKHDAEEATAERGRSQRIHSQEEELSRVTL